MSRIIWPSTSDKYEAIGYLTIPGVVTAIEATVPIGKEDKFREEYKGCFTSEYPYTANKYGNQFRIYLNDVEGCPDFLLGQLDSTYGCRINDTNFIKELVLEFGFRFTRGEQNYDLIKEIAFRKANSVEREAYRKGLSVYRDFIGDLEKKLFDEEIISEPVITEEKSSEAGREKRTKSLGQHEGMVSLTQNQALNIGWLGEAYLYSLLQKRNVHVLNALGINATTAYEIEWYNKGYNEAETVYEGVDPKHLEPVKQWDDQSVGKGCDIVVKIPGKSDIFIEVKTSKRTAPIFSMTTAEVVKMEKEADHYFLIKINNIEKVIYDEKPDLIVFSTPFKTFFHPNRIKDATFYLKG